MIEAIAASEDVQFYRLIITRLQPKIFPIINVNYATVDLFSQTRSHMLFCATFQWLQEEFLLYFDKWEQSVTARKGFEDQASKEDDDYPRNTPYRIKVNGNVCNSLLYVYT